MQSAINCSIKSSFNASGNKTETTRLFEIQPRRSAWFQFKSGLLNDNYPG